MDEEGTVGMMAWRYHGRFSLKSARDFYPPPMHLHRSPRASGARTFHIVNRKS